MRESIPASFMRITQAVKNNQYGREKTIVPGDNKQSFRQMKNGVLPGD